MTQSLTNAARQREHWDAVLDADNRGRRRVTARRLQREVAFTRTPEAAPLWRAVAARPDPLVIDLGGGLGAWAVALARRGHRVVVADVSGERLRCLRNALRELGLADRVLLLQSSAEHLALRSQVADVIWTRSVLIHTDLEAAMGEIARCLAPEGEAVLCEPADANPLVNLYRRWLGPPEWRALAAYFTPERVDRALSALREGRQERFHVLGFLAFFWQFAVPSVWLFRLMMALLAPLDRLLMRLWSGWRRRAWFVVMTGKGLPR